jgi:hypothetical protein
VFPFFYCHRIPAVARDPGNSSRVNSLLAVV